jgi:hypothetical protein
MAIFGCKIQFASKWVQFEDQNVHILAKNPKNSKFRRRPAHKWLTIIIKKKRYNVLLIIYRLGQIQGPQVQPPNRCPWSPPISKSPLDFAVGSSKSPKEKARRPPPCRLHHPTENQYIQTVLFRHLRVLPKGKWEKSAPQSPFDWELLLNWSRSV